MTVRKKLKKGDQCPAVIGLVVGLQMAHFMTGFGTVDESVTDLFDEQVEHAVTRFQSWCYNNGVLNSHEITGIVDEKTFGLMQRFLRINLLYLADYCWPEGQQEKTVPVTVPAPGQDPLMMRDM